MTPHLKIGLVAMGLLFQVSAVRSQTCCSGGVPVSNSLGFTRVDQGVLQLSISADLNVLKDLYAQDCKLADDQRERTTQSLNFRASYTFTDRLAVETFFPLIKQTRNIYSTLGSVDEQSSFGVGDPVLLMICDLVKSPFLWRVGLGPQIPLGRTTIKNDRGLLLVEDLQPGSGAWDALAFMSAIITSYRRPSRRGFINGIYSRAGKNPDSREGSQTYQFGNELQLIVGVSEQFLALGQLFDLGIGARYRKAQRDRIDGFANSSTGGQFLFSRLQLGLTFPMTEITLSAELPLYTKVNETQLASSYLLNVGFLHRIASSRESK